MNFPIIYTKLRITALSIGCPLLALGSLNATWDIHLPGKDEIVEEARQETESRDETRDRHDRERFEDGRMESPERESWSYSHQARD